MLNAWKWIKFFNDDLARFFFKIDMMIIYIVGVVFFRPKSVIEK